VEVFENRPQNDAGLVGAILDLGGESSIPWKKSTSTKGKIMGLAEKRATATLKEKFEGEWKKKVYSAAKCEIPIEVSWDTIVKEGTSDSAEEAFSQIFVNTLESAFQRICTDDMSKEAVKEGVKKITITNSGAHHSFLGDGLSFKNGILVMDHRFTNVDQLEERVRAVVNSISAAL